MNLFTKLYILIFQHFISIKALKSLIIYTKVQGYDNYCYRPANIRKLLYYSQVNVLLVSTYPNIVCYLFNLCILAPIYCSNR